MAHSMLFVDSKQRHMDALMYSSALFGLHLVKLKSFHFPDLGWVAITFSRQLSLRSPFVFSPDKRSLVQAWLIAACR